MLKLRDSEVFALKLEKKKNLHKITIIAHGNQIDFLFFIKLKVKPRFLLAIIKVFVLILFSPLEMHQFQCLFFPPTFKQHKVGFKKKIKNTLMDNLNFTFLMLPEPLNICA